MKWIALSQDKIKEIEKMYMNKKDYIEASIEYSGYTVKIRFDKKRLIEAYEQDIIMTTLLKGKQKSLKELIQLQLLIELKDIIGGEDKHKLIMFS
jgi:hypothetical protein